MTHIINGTVNSRKNRRCSGSLPPPLPTLSPLSPQSPSLRFLPPEYSQKYHTVLMSKDVNANNCSLFDIIHWSLLVKQPWSHQIGSFQHKFDCPCVGCEAGVHVRVGVDGSKSWYAVVLNIDEVMLLINNNMFGFMVVSSLQFVDDNFAFLGKNDLHLFLPKFGPLEKTSS